MDEACAICRALSDDQNEEVIFETAYWRVALAPDQLYLGRAFVTLLEHVESLPELDTRQLVGWHDTVIRYEGLVWERFGAANFNWSCLMNNAFQEPEPRPHVHWHVRPRYAKTPVLGGREYPDPNFGHHYERDMRREVGAEELAAIGDYLRAEL